MTSLQKKIIVVATAVVATVASTVALYATRGYKYSPVKLFGNAISGMKSTEEEVKSE